MTDEEKSQQQQATDTVQPKPAAKKKEPLSKEEKLAQALRANLRRRKQSAKDRKDQDNG